MMTQNDSRLDIGKGKLIDKFIKGRLVATIEAGETQSEAIPLDTKTQSVVLFCKTFDNNGDLVRRSSRLTVTEEGDVAIISIGSPLKQTIRVLYRIVPPKPGGEDDKNVDDDIFGNIEDHDSGRRWWKSETTSD